MKKIVFGLFALLMVMSCTKDTFEIEEQSSFVPKALQIVEPVGLKLESTFVTDKVSINVKLPQDGVYRLKIKNIEGKLVSQEKLTAVKGDNLLSIYTNSLEKTSYSIDLQDESGNILGSSIFVILN